MFKRPSEWSYNWNKRGYLNEMVKGSGRFTIKSPFFVKKRVKKRVEDEAEALGADVVTADHVNICKNRFMNRMEDEIKGFRIETCFSSSGCPNSIMDISGFSEGIEKLCFKEDIKRFLRKNVKGPFHRRRGKRI